MDKQRYLSILMSAEIPIDPETNAIYVGLPEEERELRTQQAAQVAEDGIRRLLDTQFDNLKVTVTVLEREDA